MSTLNTSILLGHTESQISVSSAASETVGGNDALFLNISVGTTDYEIDPAEITGQRAVAIRLLSGDDVIAGLDGTNYPFRITDTGGAFFRFNEDDGTVEITTITAEADTAGSLNGDYFDLTDANGTVRVWLDVNSAGTAPAVPAGGRLLEVDLATGATAEAVAVAIVAALTTDGMFTATNAVEVLTITDKYPGVRANASAGTTTWAAPVKSQTGVAVPTTIHIKSKGVSQVMIGVVPI